MFYPLDCRMGRNHRYTHSIGERDAITDNALDWIKGLNQMLYALNWRKDAITDIRTRLEKGTQSEIYALDWRKGSSITDIRTRLE